MNFYIGNYIKDINYSSYNVIVSDELLRFISYLPYTGFETLYNIHPYDDVEIHIEDLPIIIDICEFILENSLLEKYTFKDEKEDGEDALHNLIKICKDAIKMNLGLVSIGD